jgi:hypothetical protein
MNPYEKKLKFYIETKNIYKMKKYMSKLNYNCQYGGANYKEKIIDYILSNFSTDEYERMTDYNEEHGFKNYNHFVKHNIKCVKELSNSDLEFLSVLIDKIKNNEIMQCDEENFVEWESYTLYFNKYKKEVIMHPR